MLCRITEYPAKSTRSEFIYGTGTAEFLGEQIPSVLIYGKITFLCRTGQPLFRTWKRGKKESFFYRTSPVCWFSHWRLFSFITEKGRYTFEEEENEILQRNIEENSSNIVQNQEQVAVSSIASVVKTSTSSYSSGKSQISNKNSSSGSREWTHNEIIELIVLYGKRKKPCIRYPVCSIKREINNDSKQHWFLSIINCQFH